MFPHLKFVTEMAAPANCFSVIYSNLNSVLSFLPTSTTTSTVYCRVNIFLSNCVFKAQWYFATFSLHIHLSFQQLESHDKFFRITLADRYANFDFLSFSERIYWEYNSGNLEVPFSGTPFAVRSCLTKHCQYGSHYYKTAAEKLSVGANRVSCVHVQTSTILKK